VNSFKGWGVCSDMPHTLSLTRTYPDGTTVTATATGAVLTDLPLALHALEEALRCVQRASGPKPAPAAPPAPENASAELVALRAAVDAVVITDVTRQPDQTTTGVSNHTRLNVPVVQASLERLADRFLIVRDRNTIGTYIWRAADTSIDEDVYRLLSEHCTVTIAVIAYELRQPVEAVRAALARLYEAGRVHTDSSGRWCRTLGKVVHAARGPVPVFVSTPFADCPIFITYDTP
jgi:hypothetical protein